MLFGGINIISFLTILPALLDIVAPLKESRNYEIPFPIETFYDTKKYFYVTILLMYFMLNIMGCVSIGLYGFLLVILQHCNGLFELVGYILENSIEDKEYFTDKDKEKIFEKIIRGIWFHKRAIKLILHIELTIQNGKEIITSVMHIIGNLIWAFINCYFGQRVIDRSSEVHTKICNARWYSSSTKIQKLILLIITRSIRPSCVMIGGAFISSMELFASITQSSVSYAMIFYSL
ncbi:hypothetical protein M0802_006862 [Mischocyttarus mexicanus]|nr:hypothetical protein M0802_006862 [Mischocyttarus mexicanus]